MDVARIRIAEICLVRHDIGVGDERVVHFPDVEGVVSAGLPGPSGTGVVGADEPPFRHGELLAVRAGKLDHRAESFGFVALGVPGVLVCTCRPHVKGVDTDDIDVCVTRVEIEGAVGVRVQRPVDPGLGICLPDGTDHLLEAADP